MPPAARAGPSGRAGRRLPAAAETQVAVEACADDEVHIALSSDYRAPGEARRAVGTTLLRWRLPHLLDAITLVVSELVTNAVRHGLPPVRLVLARRGRNVRIAVYDDGVTAPAAPRLPDPQAESGRGLAIVAAYATESGVETGLGDGKAVFAQFDSPGDAP